MTTAGPSSSCRPHLVLRASRGWVSINWRELWEYRELLYFLVWRDLKVRYKQTIVGASWAIIQPVCMMIVFSVVFGKLAKLPSQGLPYPVFNYSALLPWQFFAKALTEASTSLVMNERIIGKVYFPRILVPTAVTMAGLVDFLIAFVVLVVLMVYYGITPTWAIFLTPVFLLVTIITALGLAFWLSALDVEFRDVRYTLPFLTQLWFFATPIAYSSAELVPERWQTLYGLNPMVGVVEGFRWSLLGTPAPNFAMLGVSAATVVVIFVGGVMFFRRMERTLADRL